MLDGTLSLDLINGFESSVQIGDMFTLATSSSLSGVFTNVPSGGFLSTDNVGFQIFYGTGSPFGANDVTAQAFTVVPEPGTFALLGAAGIALFVFRRRRRAQEF